MPHSGSSGACMSSERSPVKPARTSARATTSNRGGSKPTGAAITLASLTSRESTTRTGCSSSTTASVRSSGAQTASPDFEGGYQSRVPARMVPLIVVVTCLAIAWLSLRLRSVADVACGYKAKVLCTAIFASGRDIDPQTADEISADSYWLLRPFRAKVDRRAGRVTASFLGTRAHTAIYRAGFGATLVYANAQRDLPVVASRSTHEHIARPSTRSGRATTGPLVVSLSKHEHTASHPAVRRVVDRAFEEPNPHRLRRTHAVVVVHDGDVIAERYSRGVGADTPLPGWSMAKSVLSALVGILVADGRLALEQRELLPQWRVPDPRAGICLEDLLRMRSGLRFSEAYGNPWSDVLHMLFNCRDAAAYAASRPLDALPGRVWAYASGTSNILSAIVRRTVGDADYAEWPRRALFEPLGMPSAILEPDEAGTFICSSYMLATT